MPTHIPEFMYKLTYLSRMCEEESECAKVCIKECISKSVCKGACLQEAGSLGGKQGSLGEWDLGFVV